MTMMTPSDSTWPLRMTADAAFGYRGEIPAARFEFPSPRVGVTIESRLLSSSKLSRVCRACRAASPSGRQHGILHFRPEQKLEFAHASRFRVLKTRLSVRRTGQLGQQSSNRLFPQRVESSRVEPRDSIARRDRKRTALIFADVSTNV